MQVTIVEKQEAEILVTTIKKKKKIKSLTYKTFIYMRKIIKKKRHKF